MNNDDQNTGKKTTAARKPGMLIHEKGAGSLDFRAKVIIYGEDQLVEKTYENIDPLLKEIDDKNQLWINIDGIHHKDAVEKICGHFGIHPLLKDDIMNRQHRPKCEVFPNYIFVTMRMLGLSAKNPDEIVDEQVSFVVGDHWVLSFQVKRGDIFEKVRENMRTGSTKILKTKPDYLMCRLMDVIVDNYFYITEHISDQIETLETEAYSAQGDVFIKNIQQQKKQLIFLRRSIVPLREVMVTLKSGETSHIVTETTSRYFNDIHDHVIQATETVDTQREFLTSIMDLNLSQVSHKMNQVMQLLTIISTLFIPLTFIVGVYGMNFSYMPELNWKYAYFGVWGIMVFLTIVLIRFFKRKNWM